MLLKDRVVIVTGAARGIGKAYSKGIAAEGGKVVVSDILDGEQTVEEIRKAGGEAMYVHVDVADEKSVDGLAQAANSRYGRIDGLVNNAAIFANLRYASFDKITVKEWDAVMSVNVKGVWLASKAVYPVMKGQGSGKIINIASGVPFKGNPVFAHYTVSKGAVITLTRVLARSMGKDGICVNAVAPGLTRSESLAEARGELMDQDEEGQIKSRSIPRGELPEDLVGAIVFFLSEAANFISGQTLLVDGGSHMN
jgi:NAD(P)-dependent dehydrogenase (short-subunit alcohol dehydrogenase family)